MCLQFISCNLHMNIQKSVSNKAGPPTYIVVRQMRKSGVTKQRDRNYVRTTRNLTGTL